MKIEEKFNLIARDTEELVTEQKIRNLLMSKKKINSYWGVATTGPPHIGYYRTISKQMDLANAGLKHKILIADLHAFLDDMKAPWEELDKRAQVYTKCFQLLGLTGDNIEYFKGSEIQLSREYHLELLKASARVTINRTIRSASEVVRMSNPKVSSLIYPLMQALDCWALDADIAYSGIDNRHVYMLASELLAKANKKIPSYIFTPLGLGLAGGGKMSASEKKTRLELYAQPEEISKKIKKASCPEGEIKNNPIIEYCKYLVFPRIDKLKIPRPEKYGGDLILTDFTEVEEIFLKKELHPQDLKSATAEYLIKILKPIRDYFDKNDDLLATFKND